MSKQKNIVSFDRYDQPNSSMMGISYYVYGGCKFNCDYCFLVGYNRSDEWRTRAAPRGFKKQPSLDTNKTIVDTLFQIKHEFFIYLYGGEPTEYQHLHELVEYINNKKSDTFSHIEIQSNLNTTTLDLERLIRSKDVYISPTLHLGHLKKDTIYDLVDKIDLIYSHNRLERVDFIMSLVKEKEVRELHDILKAKPYFNKVMYTRNFLEINTGAGGLNEFKNDKDVYTGRFNTGDVFKDICEQSIYKEQYIARFDDGSEEVYDINDLYTHGEMMNFKGWLCEAGKKLMLVDYTGDWWICDNEYLKSEPGGNLIDSPSKFLLNTRIPHVCKLDKCDGCFFIDRKKI